MVVEQSGQESLVFLLLDGFEIRHVTNDSIYTANPVYQIGINVCPGVFRPLPVVPQRLTQQVGKVREVGAEAAETTKEIIFRII